MNPDQTAPMGGQSDLDPYCLQYQLIQQTMFGWKIPSGKKGLMNCLP